MARIAQQSLENSALITLYREYAAIEKDRETSQFSESVWAEENPEKQTRFDALPELMRKALVDLPMRVTYAGESKANDWHCDRWNVDFINGRMEETTEYKTGLGLRKLSKTDEVRYRNLCREYRNSRTYPLVTAEFKRNYAKPVKPENADILHCLLGDAQANQMSFYEWCDTFGYDNDSIKAESIYRQCCETDLILKRWVNPEVLKAIEVATQEM